MAEFGWVIVDCEKHHGISFASRLACEHFVFAFQLMLAMARHYPEHRIWLERDTLWQYGTIFGPRPSQEYVKSDLPRRGGEGW